MSGESVNLELLHKQDALIMIQSQMFMCYDPCTYNISHRMRCTASCCT